MVPMQKAAKEKMFLFLLAIASALLPCAPLAASSETVLTSKTRAELFSLGGENRVEQSAFDSVKRVENGVCLRGIVLGSSVAPGSGGWRAAANAADELADAPFAPGSVGAARAWTSIKSRLKAAQLPTSGKIRFVPPKNYSASSPLTRGPQNGYLDRFGNEWVRGNSRTAGEAFEWDVQLSNRGREMLGWLSREGNHVNISLRGIVTH